MDPDGYRVDQFCNTPGQTSLCFRLFHLRNLLSGTEFTACRKANLAPASKTEELFKLALYYQRVLLCYS